MPDIYRSGRIKLGVGTDLFEREAARANFSGIHRGGDKSNTTGYRRRTAHVERSSCLFVYYCAFTV